MTPARQPTGEVDPIGQTKKSTILDDPTPLIHQVAEWFEVEPTLAEYRPHRLSCPASGERS